MFQTNLCSNIFFSHPTVAKVLCNVDELFDREEFSAAPDSGWPDCFNSGVFVFRPSLKTYNLLLQFAAEHGSFDGKGQGTRIKCKTDSSVSCFSIACVLSDRIEAGRSSSGFM